MVKKTASMINAYTEKLMADVSVRNLLLLDYIEDVMDYIYGTESAPCSLLEFVEYCLVVPIDNGYGIRLQYV